MGGYVAQAYAELFPDKLRGFVLVDSAPLQRSYYTAAELWLLKRVEPVYRRYPWKSLVKAGSEGVATSAYGRELMRSMRLAYDGDRDRYVRLVGHGYRILAEAIEADLPYELRCPALLLCGTRDCAGSCVRYSKAWHRRTGIPLHWVEGAGHNTNTDVPAEVNRLIEDFARGL
jgi:pimeloyl-ACP methyl ester carboxylesterase